MWVYPVILIALSLVVIIINGFQYLIWKTDEQMDSYRKIAGSIASALALSDEAALDSSRSESKESRSKSFPSPTSTNGNNRGAVRRNIHRDDKQSSNSQLYKLPDTVDLSRPYFSPSKSANNSNIDNGDLFLIINEGSPSVDIAGDNFGNLLNSFSQGRGKNFLADSIENTFLQGQSSRKRSPMQKNYRKPTSSLERETCLNTEKQLDEINIDFNSFGTNTGLDSGAVDTESELRSRQTLPPPHVLGPSTRAHLLMIDEGLLAEGSSLLNHIIDGNSVGIEEKAIDSPSKVKKTRNGPGSQLYAV